MPWIWLQDMFNRMHVTHSLWEYSSSSQTGVNYFEILVSYIWECGSLCCLNGHCSGQVDTPASQGQQTKHNQVDKHTPLDQIKPFPTASISLGITSNSNLSLCQHDAWRQTNWAGTEVQWSTTVNYFFWSSHLRITRTDQELFQKWFQFIVTLLVWWLCRLHFVAKF